MTALGLLVAVIAVAIGLVTLTAAALLAAIGETLGRGLAELGRERAAAWAPTFSRVRLRISAPSRG